MSNMDFTRFHEACEREYREACSTYADEWGQPDDDNGVTPTAILVGLFGLVCVVGIVWGLAAWVG